VTFLLRAQNPYTHVPTLVYTYQPEAVNYPTYSYFPGALFAEVPFYLLGTVRLGLALAEKGTALLLYLFARPRLGVWPARCVAVFWLLFLRGFQVPLPDYRPRRALMTDAGQLPLFADPFMDEASS